MRSIQAALIVLALVPTASRVTQAQTFPPAELPGHDVFPASPALGPSMSDLQQQLDEVREKQAQDVHISPEAVQADEIRITGIQDEMRALATKSSPGSGSTLDALIQQQNTREAEGQMNANEADTEDDDPRPY